MDTSTGQQRQPPQACPCQHLHGICDPASCSKAIGSPSGVPFLFTKHSRARDWDEGARRGCMTCAAVMGAAQKLLVRSEDIITVRQWSGEFSVFDVPLFRERTNSQSTACRAIPLATFPDSTRTDSAEAFAFCKAMLSVCLKNHTLCQSENLYKYPLPQRLIYVGEPETQPRLVEVLGKPVDYLTLSHCWGNMQIITTTKNTLAEHLRQISWGKLSKTFQDALTITYELGYQYIWIDSLCIVQDDRSDWETESKNMASIYQNTILTIAASGSASGSGGCFSQTRDLPGEEIPNIYTSLPTGVFSRRHISHFHVEDTQVGDATRLPNTKWPLFQRAWTLQEHLLSSRVIHYGPEELIWQCNTECECQCGTIQYHRPANLPNKASFTQKLQRDQYGFANLQKHRQSLEFEWYKVTMEFTTRMITKQNDRLPALSGLTKQFQAAGLSPLVAGIPTNNVHPWLLWKYAETLPKARPIPYNAPSWSWMSCQSGRKLGFQDDVLPVFFKGYYKLEPVAQVVDINVVLEGLDPNGAIISGHLSLYSYVSLLPDHVRNVTIQRGLQVKGIQHYRFGSVINSCRFDFLSNIDYADYADAQGIVCVLISRIIRIGDAFGSSTTFGLLLNPVEETPSLYQRIGLFKYTSEILEELKGHAKSILTSTMPWDGFELREITIV